MGAVPAGFRTSTLAKLQLQGETLHLVSLSSSSSAVNYLNVINYPRCRREDQGNAFESVCLSVCLSVHARNSETVAPIDLFVLHKKYYARGLVHL